MRLLAEASGTGMLVNVWSFAWSLESSEDKNLVLCALMSVSIKDNPCESHIGPNFVLRNLHCIDRSCELLGGEGGMVVVKASALFTEAAVNGLLWEGVWLGRVTQV